MANVAYGTPYAGYWLTKKIDFFLDGEAIGYWFVESALQDKYGEFVPNEYFESLYGKGYWGGDSWHVARRLQKWVVEHHG